MSQRPSLVKPYVVMPPSFASVILRASPPSGRMRYSWNEVPPIPPPTAAGKYGAPGPLVGNVAARAAAAAFAAAASRSERKTKYCPSRDQVGLFSLLSAVYVSRFVLDTP